MSLVTYVHYLGHGILTHFVDKRKYHCAVDLQFDWLGLN